MSRYWSKLPAATPKKGPYYGGVALLSKIPPKSCDFTALAGHLDDEGRAFVATFASSSSISSSSPSFTNSDGGFHLLHTYVPNASQGLKRLKEKQEYNAAVERLMARLDTQLPVIWCGDLNVAHQDIDLTNPKTNRKSPGFTNEGKLLVSSDWLILNNFSFREVRLFSYFVCWTNYSYRV
jgi:exodeoxyribonuclease III